MNKKQKEEPRIGDVWESEKGHRFVTVVPKSEYHGFGDGGDWRDVAYRGTTGVVMIALAANFIRGRRLIRRGDVRVGELRATGQASTLRVLSIEGDAAMCEMPDRNITMSLTDVASMPVLAYRTFGIHAPTRFG